MRNISSLGVETLSGTSPERFKDLQEKLESLNKHSRLGDVRGEIRRLENDLNRLLALNESYWRQKVPCGVVKIRGSEHKNSFMPKHRIDLSRMVSVV